MYIRQFCLWAWFSSELVQLKEIHTLRMQVARHKNHARKYNFLCSQLRRGGQKKHWTASFISVYKFSSLKKALGGLNTVATLLYKIVEDLEGLKVWQSRVFPVHFTIFPTCKKGWAIVLFHNRVVVKTCRKLLCATHSFDVSKSSRSIKRQTFWFLTTQYWLTYGQLKKTGSEGTRSEKDTKQKYISNWTRVG